MCEGSFFVACSVPVVFCPLRWQRINLVQIASYGSTKLSCLTSISICSIILI